MVDITTQTTHSGKNCSVVETITKTFAFPSSKNALGVSRSWLIINGATVTGTSTSFSIWLLPNGTSSVIGTGTETHSFKAQVPDGCTLVKCNIKGKCIANGGFTGVLQDSGMNANGDAQLNVCDQAIPIRLDLTAQKDPSEDKKTIKIKTGKGNTEVEFEWEWKKTTGGTGSQLLPNISNTMDKSCMMGLVEFESISTVSLSSWNGDYTGNVAEIDAAITNEIEIISVDVECQCPEEKVGMRIGKVEEGAKKELVNKQLKQIGKPLGQFKKELTKLTSTYKDILIDDKFKKNSIDQIGLLSESIQSTDNIEIIDQIKKNVISEKVIVSEKRRSEINKKTSILQFQIAALESIEKSLKQGYVIVQEDFQSIIDEICSER